MPLSDYVRIDWKLRRATPLTLEAVVRESHAHVTTADEFWREHVSEGTRQILADKANAETSAAQIAKLEHGAHTTLARAGMRRFDVPITQAVQRVAAEHDAHVHVPTVKGDPWIVRGAEGSVYAGKVYALFPGADGKTTIARQIEAEHAPTLLGIASGEGLGSIPELISKRIQQRADACAPERHDEDEQSALARMRLRRAIAADEAATGGRGLLTGAVFKPPKPLLGEDARQAVLSDVHDRIAAERAARDESTTSSEASAQ